MSRHRNIHRLNSDDYDTYEDLLPSSVDDDCGMSPNAAQQFSYPPLAGLHGVGQFLPTFKEQFSFTASEFPNQEDIQHTLIDEGDQPTDGSSMLELQFDDLMLENGCQENELKEFGFASAASTVDIGGVSVPSTAAILDNFPEELDFNALTNVTGMTKSTHHLNPNSQKVTRGSTSNSAFSFHFAPKICLPKSPAACKYNNVTNAPGTITRLGFAFSNLHRFSKTSKTADDVTNLLVILRHSRASAFLYERCVSNISQLPRFKFLSPYPVESKSIQRLHKMQLDQPPKSRRNLILKNKGKPSVDLETQLNTSIPLSEALQTSYDFSVKELSDPKVIASTPSKIIDRKPLMQAYTQQHNLESEKEILNLIVVGHVDAGKSTLMGNVLYQLGRVSGKQLSKYRWEAQKLGKASFAYAWVLDQTAEERSRGITMDIAQTAFETANKRVVLLDAPGHRDFVPQVIGGAAQADIALLVVNATSGEFETGMMAGGQTREHARLVRLLGVSRLIVVINKMDTVAWAQSRFIDICNALSAFLKTINFQSGVVFCPVSGLLGVNLVNSTSCPAEADIEKLAPWYDGPCLLDIIDNLEGVDRAVEGPFRFVVSDIFKPVGSSAAVVAGRIVCGAISSGVNLPTSRIVCLPSGHSGVVKSIRSLSGACDTGKTEGTLMENIVKFAFAGDQVGLMLQNVEAVSSLTAGDVICDPDNLVPVTNRLRARILVFEVSQPITRGYPVIFYYHCCSVSATITKLLAATVKENKTRKEVARPRCLFGNCTADVEITLDRPVCLEVYDVCKSLGRFMLRVAGESIAGGTVSALLPQKSISSSQMFS